MDKKIFSPQKNLDLSMFLLLLILIWPLEVFSYFQSQEASPTIEELKKQAPKIYLDCTFCDLDYIRTEITFVNYVRDRKEAQIYILVTTQRTGGGGQEYTLTFLGEKDFAGINHVQKYFSSQTNTEDEIRQGLVQTIKIGLMPYLARTPLRHYLAINYFPEVKTQETKDRWNYWVFNLRGRGYFRGESNYHDKSTSLNFSANRVTDESKVRLSFYYGENKSTFKYDNLKIVSQSEGGNFTGLYVKSLSEHWSAGFYLTASSSTYENIKFSINPAPAIEYNFFPYSQSARRQLRCLYRLNFTRVNYREETIYDKLKESLWGQSLSLTLDLREKWGTVSVTLSGSHYFHDWQKNRLTAFGVINLFLFKGLSFYVLGGGSRIHDQLSLAKRGASLEEVLLLRRQLETSYSYFVSIGFSYTFGSVFSNVVNPRFGTESEEGIRIEIN